MTRVTTIPATKNKFTALPTASIAKRRTAGYARVSTDKDEQFTSYEAQVDYYTKYIQSREDWEFVTVYTDEGISALDTKHREGFQQMVRDALDGKIDLIVTKSVSRFARNTVDSLVTIRKLKEKGVECYFEKDYIKHDINPWFYWVFAVFCFRFVACLSLKFTKQCLKILIVTQKYFANGLRFA